MPLPMRVAMRIDVRGRAAHDAMKFIELAEEFVLAGLQVLRIELALVFAPDIPVQADREIRVLLAQLNCFIQCAAGDHEAGAGEHTLGVAIDDATIDAMRSAKIIGVEDEISSIWIVLHL